MPFDIATPLYDYLSVIPSLDISRPSDFNALEEYDLVMFADRYTGRLQFGEVALNSPAGEFSVDGHIFARRVAKAGVVTIIPLVEKFFFLTEPTRVDAVTPFNVSHRRAAGFSGHVVAFFSEDGRFIEGRMSGMSARPGNRLALYVDGYDGVDREKGIIVKSLLPVTILPAVQ